MTEATPRDPAVQELLDKQAIVEVLMKYCRGVDRRDPDLLTSIYHPDAYDDHVGRHFDGTTVGQGLVDWMYEEMEVTTHNITTYNIEIDGDVAGSESYTTSVHLRKMDGEVRTILSLARYVDRMERRDGVNWKIASRIVVSEFSGQIAMDRNQFPTLARQDRSDPSYTVLSF